MSTHYKSVRATSVAPASKKASRFRDTHQDLVNKHLEQRVKDSDPHIRPRRANRVRVVVAGQRKSQRNSVEDSRLLMEMVVVVSNGLDIVWDFLFEFLVELAWVDGDIIFADSVDAGCVHPGLHYEGPSCEDCDGLVWFRLVLDHGGVDGVRW